MLKVLFTVDTEVWCGRWNNLDEVFPDAFRSYVYGPTSKGDFALPGLFRILGEHGLKGVFMIESLFSTRFGRAPLEEIVGLIAEAGHEIQLHLHPEWVDEAHEPLLESKHPKKTRLGRFSLAEQTTLIARGRELLEAAGAPAVNTFRAGSFAFNTDTLRALRHVNIPFDTSYNIGCSAGVDDVAKGTRLAVATEIEGTVEFPVTNFFDDGARSIRPLQLTACSFEEHRDCLDAAEARGDGVVIIVGHNFELLTPDKRRADPVVTRRFERLCSYLAAHPDRFDVCGFHDLPQMHVTPPEEQPPLLAGSRARKALRMVEQLRRRFV